MKRNEMAIFLALLAVIFLQLLSLVSTDRIEPVFAQTKKSTPLSNPDTEQPVTAGSPTSGISAFPINKENAFIVVDGHNRFIKYYMVEWYGPDPRIVEKTTRTF